MKARWVLMTCVVACVVTWSWADVFWRRPANIPGNWTQGFVTPYETQGHQGTVTVYGTQDQLGQIEAALQDRHGDQLAWFPGDIMAWALAVEDGRIYRYLIQPRPNGDHWILLFDSNLSSAPPPGTKPDVHQLKKLPAPVGGIPTFYSHDKGNEAMVEISKVPGSPEGALISMGQQLRSSGWTPSPINTGGFQMYVKGKSVAFLGSHYGKDGITRVLRLHKPLGVQ